MAIFVIFFQQQYVYKYVTLVVTVRLVLFWVAQFLWILQYLQQIGITMNIKKVNVLTGIIFSKLYFIYPVFKNVFRKSGNILTELLKKIVVHESLKLICPSISKETKTCAPYSQI